MRIVFETERCSRCGGSGVMPYAAYDGKCFKCHGSGKVYTRAGRASFKKYDKWASETLAVRADAVTVGQVVFDCRRRMTCVESAVVDTLNAGYVVIKFQRLSFGCSPDHTFRRQPTSDELRTIAPKLGKGATLVEATD